MVETDGLNDAANETELEIKQRSLANRHLNGSLENKSTAKPNRDPPKNLVNYQFICHFSPIRIHALGVDSFNLKNHFFPYILCIRTRAHRSQQMHRGR